MNAAYSVLPLTSKMQSTISHFPFEYYTFLCSENKFTHKKPQPIRDKSKIMQASLYYIHTGSGTYAEYQEFERINSAKNYSYCNRKAINWLCLNWGK